MTPAATVPKAVIVVVPVMRIFCVVCAPRSVVAADARSEQNKPTRMSIQSAKFESGQVFFPRSAPWLEDLEAELFAFPGSRHDDQVDSISQALGHGIKQSGWTAESLEGFSRLIDGMAMDRYFGMISGRPW